MDDHRDTESRSVEFFFDFVSPYAYFASARIEALAARYGRRVDWKPILVGVTVMKVMGLKPLPETPLKSDYIAHDKPRMARLLGIPFHQPDMAGVSSVAAMRAFVALTAKGPETGRSFAHAAFRRLWVEGRGISTTEDITELCAQTGADAAIAIESMTSPEGRETLRKAVDEAITRKVFGTPFFIIDAEPIWGVDRLWMVEHWLKHGSWDPLPEA